MIPKLLLLLTISMPRIVFFTCIPAKIQQFLSYHPFSNHTTITHGVNHLPLPLMQRTRWSSLMGLLRPTKTDPTYQAWRRCNNMVVSWLTHFVSPSIRQSILWMDKFEEIWKDLKSRFFQGNLLGISELQLEASSLKQGNLSVTKYFKKIRVI